MKYTLLIFFLLTVAIYVSGEKIDSTKSIPLSTPTPFVKKEIDKAKLWQIIQNWRKENGHNEYVEYDLLCSAAEERLSQIKKNWSHDGYIEISSKYVTYSFLGENLFKDWPTEEAGFQSWLSSPSHLANLEKDYTYSCIATDGNYVVHLFMNP